MRWKPGSCRSRQILSKEKMQPTFPHRPEAYPPRGNVWPQFGDDVLEDTLSISEGARQNLNRKREGMSDWHQENMQCHGLAPPPSANTTPLSRPPAPPRPPQGPQGSVPGPQALQRFPPVPDDEMEVDTPSNQPPPPPQGGRVRYSPQPNTGDVSVTVPATQPPAPPGAPNRRYPQNPLRIPLSRLQSCLGVLLRFLPGLLTVADGLCPITTRETTKTQFQGWKRREG